MNLKDDEWEPEPTDPHLLRKVRTAAASTVSTHDLANLRTFLLAPPFNGAIPHELRGTIWLLLLRLRSEDLLDEDPSHFAQCARHAVAEQNSREQIEKDVHRTRPGLARFKQPAVRGALLRLLSLFCDRHKVAYVQGLNELLAPFILLADTGSNPRIAYALFSSFVARFAPWTLETSETRMFEVLKRLFKYFERLLLYHDPDLYWLLDHHAMTPDLYATSWFITLYSRNFTVESVLALWDLLLLEDDPLGTSFFAIALLRSKRDALFSIDESRIPETLMLLTASSPEEVRRLWKIGSEMRTRHTPPSFQRLMTDRTVNDGSTPTHTAMSAARYMQGSVCLQTTPDDLVAGDSQFFTWDCRSTAEYNAGHLAQAAFLPLDHLRTLNGEIGRQMTENARGELQHAADMCEPLKGSTHICLIGSGVREEDKTDINVVALYLTRLGVPYVSTLRGGFEDALLAVQKDDSLSCVELVNYDRRRHEQARRVRTALQKKMDHGNWRHAKRGGSGETGSGRGRAASKAEESTGTGTSFLEKTDAEVSNALVNALSGIGLKYAMSTGTSSGSIDRDGWAPDATPTSSITSGAASPHRTVSMGLQRRDRVESCDDGATSATAATMVTSTLTGSAVEGSIDGRGEGSPAWARRQVAGAMGKEAKVGRGIVDDGKAGGKCPWVRDAHPGWLSEDTLRFPLASMPKGFTVNMMDDIVMDGLRLFPCRAKAERSILGKKSSEFRKRFVGVSKYYLLLLGPYQNRSHLLEVKLIRYLQDIVRITFKRNQPELVTFAIATDSDDGKGAERVVCLMPDGLKECVDLIRGYITDDSAAGSESEGGGAGVGAGNGGGRYATSQTHSQTGSGGEADMSRKRVSVMSGGYEGEGAKYGSEDRRRGGSEGDAWMSDGAARVVQDDGGNGEDEFGELQSAPATPVGAQEGFFE